MSTVQFQSVEDQTYDVFISYSHRDAEWVRNWLLPRLERAGLSVCIDFRDFQIGVPSLVNMERAAERSQRTLLVLTPNWVQSEWTNFEALMIQTQDPVGLRRRMPVAWPSSPMLISGSARIGRQRSPACSTR